MIDVNILYLIRYKIIQKAIIIGIKLDRLVIINIKGKDAIRYKHFGLVLPNFVYHMRT